MFQEGTSAVTFNSAFYLQQNRDVFQAIQNGTFQGSALDHFIQFGQFESRDPNQFFNTEFYLGQNTDVLVAIADPANPSVTSAFQQFVMFGSEEFRAPSEPFLAFNEATYLAANPDVAAAVTAGIFANGFEHFLAFGLNEQREGSNVDLAGTTPPPTGENFLFTVGVDGLTGTANDDVFSGVVGGAAPTFQPGDQANGAGGIDRLNLTALASTTGPVEGTSINSIEQVFVRALADTTIDATLWTGVQQLWSDRSTVGSDVTFTAVQEAAALGLNNTKGDLTVEFAAGALTSGSTVSVIANNSTSTLTVNSATAAALTGIAITATGQNTIDLGSNATAIKSLTIDGSGSLELFSDSGDLGSLRTLDASANVGGVDIDLSDRAFEGAPTFTLAVTGGAGDDRFEFGVLDAKITVNGGAGFDTVAVQGGTFLTEGSNIGFNALTSVERLEFVGEAGAEITGQFLTNPGITNILFNTDGDDVINVAGSARTYEFGTENDGNATFNMKAGAETLNIDLLGDIAADGIETGALVDNILVNPAAATGTVAINIESLGGLSATLDPGGDGGFNTVGQVIARGGSTITLTGDSALLFGGVTNSGPDTGATFTTGFTINASGLQAEMILRGSTNGDTITLGSARAEVAFEAGDSGNLNTDSTNIVNFDVITGFTAGTGGDILGFGNGLFTALTAEQQTAITDGAVNLLGAFELAAAAITTNDGAGWTAFTFGGETYAAYSDGEVGVDLARDFGTGDLIVQLTGVGRTDLTAANFDTDPFGV